jgi:nitroreductase
MAGRSSADLPGATGASVTRAWDLGPDGTPGAAVAACLRAAIAAPSIHNSQPWRFRLRSPTAIDVLADYTRAVAVIDPDRRELMISLGAAVLNLRVAMRAAGRLPLAVSFPDQDEPALVARVTAGQFRPADDTIRALAAAIPHRHTNRRPFRDIEIPEQVLADLAAAARVEGASLATADPIGREAILSLVRTANDWHRANPRYLAELAAWTEPRPDRGDGVPPQAYGPWDALESLPIRDFGLAHPTLPRRAGRFEPAPTIVVLYTATDSPPDRLRAGQALQRVLLTATVHGVASTPLTAALECPELRELLTTGVDGRMAQVVLRLGYGEPAAGSPRRPLRDVLEYAAPQQR